MKQMVARWVWMISIMFCGEAVSSSVAVAPKRSGKIGEAAEAEGEGQRRGADEDVVGGDAEDLAGVAVGDDEEVAVEVHRRLRLAGGAGGEAEEGDVVAAGADGLELHGLGEGGAVELGVVVGGAVEADDRLEEAAVLGAGDELVLDAGVAEGEGDLGLVDDLRELAGAEHRHGVDDDGAGLGGGEPGGDHGRVVGGADEDAVAGLDAVVLDEGMGDAVGPVGELLVGALAAVADEGDVVAEALLDEAVGELDGGVEVVGVVEAGEVEERPLVGGRQVVAGEGVGVGGRAELAHAAGQEEEDAVGAGGLDLGDLGGEVGLAELGVELAGELALVEALEAVERSPCRPGSWGRG